MVKAGSERVSLSLDTQLCFALYSTLHAVGKSYADLLPDLGLTYPQYLVMLVLWEQDDRGMKELGERLHLDSGTLTPLLKRMEQGGLLRRTRDAVDERKMRISLTESGRDLRTKADCVPVQLGARMGRSYDEITRLRDDLLRLRASLLSPQEKLSTGSEPAAGEHDQVRGTNRRTRFRNRTAMARSESS